MVALGPHARRPNPNLRTWAGPQRPQGILARVSEALGLGSSLRVSSVGGAARRPVQRGVLTSDSVPEGWTPSLGTETPA